MFRTLAGIALMAAAGVAGTLAYSAYTAEREFARYIRLGDEAAARDLQFQAIEAYSGAIALQPESVVAHVKRGSAYRSQGAIEDAMRDLRRASELDPSATKALELLGDLNLQLTRFDRAIDQYRRYTSIDDQRAPVQYKLGLALYRAGRLADALAPLGRALTLDESMKEARFLMGLCQRDLGDLSAAQATLEVATDRSPADVGPREALAEIYELQRMNARALDQLAALATLEPSRPERMIAVGLAQARAGQRDAAVLTLGRALERFPDSPRAYAALGRVWLSVAEARSDRVALRKAIEALSLAAAHADTPSETFADLGRAQWLDGNLLGAERALRLAVSRLPVPPLAFLHLAEVTQRTGRVRDARDALVQYATLQGDEQPLAALATQIADLSLKSGEPAQAVRWFGRAIEEAGPTPVLLARLADAAWRAGDLARARRAVDEGLLLAPQDRTLISLKRRLL
jgi:tetratricopeptide (TPR) repeat protein